MKNRGQMGMCNRDPEHGFGSLAFSKANRRHLLDAAKTCTLHTFDVDGSYVATWGWNRGLAQGNPNEQRPKK